MLQTFYNISSLKQLLDSFKYMDMFTVNSAAIRHYFEFSIGISFAQRNDSFCVTHSIHYFTVQPVRQYLCRKALAAIIPQPLFPFCLKQERGYRMTPLMQNLFLPNQKKHLTKYNDKHFPLCLWSFPFAHHRKGGLVGAAVQWSNAQSKCGCLS